jgi:hypothetical protein
MAERYSYTYIDSPGASFTFGSLLPRNGSSLCRICYSVLLIFLLGLGISGAQVITADLVGTVTDATGAVIPNATVTVTNVGTQAKRTVAAGSNGEYVISLLQLGTYNLEVTAPGFQKNVVIGIKLNAGDRLRNNAVLLLGTANQTVQVNADVSALQTDNSTVMSTVGSKTTEDMPLNGRNFVNLVQVQPGVNAGPPNSVSSGNRDDDRRETSTVSANGQPELYNNYILDGLDNNDRFQGLLAVRPSLDAMREIQITTNLYTAEVGRTAGAVIDVLTKSGTNVLHGTAYEFFRNNITDAKNFFARDIRNPELRQNQFGGSIGGPIWKNQTFFFTDYEGFRQIDATGTVFITSVPTAFEHNHPGNFSDVLDPVTLKPGPVLTPAQINSTGLAYFKLFPLPNQVGTVNPTTGIASNNFLYNPAKTQYQNTFDIRIDQNFNPSNLFFARYSFSNTNTFVPGELPAVNGVQPGGVLGGGFPGKTPQGSQNAQLDYTHIFTPSLLMELRAGYTRLYINSTPLNYGNNLNDGAFSIPGANRGLDDSGLAPIDVSGYAALGDSIFLPNIILENTFQYGGNLTYTHGLHTLTMGGLLIRRQASDTQNPFGKGFFIFALGKDQLQNLADMVSGTPFVYERSNFLVTPQYRIWEPSAFVQDDWHVNSKLTLNLGVRYDVFTAAKEKNGNISNLNLSTGKLVVGGSGGIRTSYTNLAPRIGFSETIAPKTVLRGGFGLSFFPTDYQNNLILVNPPYSYATGTLVDFGKLTDGIPAPAPTSTTNLSGSLTYKPFGYRTGYMEQFNLFVQREIAGNVVTIGYVGELGRHLYETIPNLDLPAPSGSSVQDPAPYATLLPKVNTIAAYLDGGVSSYHSFEATFERRYVSGLTLSANYTLAHGINDVLDPGAGTTEAYGLLPTQVSTYDKGNSDIDVRSRLAVTASYDLPFGKDSKGFHKLLLKGWQLNSLAFWQTGQPFTITNATPRINLPTVTVDRPNVVGNPILAKHSLNEFFNISSFVAQPLGTAGDVSRNSLYGPHLRRVDLSLFKNVDIHKSLKLQVRAECFNISNTPNFANPNSEITATNSSGVAQSSGSFGAITSTNLGVAARQFQFAAKLIF